MERICFLVFLISLLLHQKSDVLAQSEKRVFQRLTVEDGLPSNVISSLYSDHKGFLWISTNDALSRYDAYSFMNLRTDPFDSTSLPGGHGMKIIQDQDNKFYLQFPNGKITLFDPVSRKFTPSPITSFTDYSLQRVFGADKDACYALHNRAGLALVNTRTGEVAEIKVDDKFDKLLFRNIERLTSDVIAVATSDARIFLYSESKKTVRQILPELEGNQLTKLYVRENGNLLAAVEGGTLIELNPSTNAIEKHTPVRYFEKLQFNSIAEDNYSTLWIGSNYGLISYNMVSRQSQQFMHDPNDPQSISDNSIPVVLIDSSGVLWASSLKGLNKTVIVPNRFRTKSFDFLPNFKTFFDDGKGNIWTGSPKKGLIVLPKDAEYIQTRHQRKSFDFKNTTTFHFANSMTLLPLSENRIWLATFFDGIYEFETDSKSFKKQYGLADGLPSLSVSSMYKDSKDRIWVSTNSGVLIFDETTAKFKPAFEVLQDTSIKSLKSARVIFEDRYGTFWFGTSYNGLFEYDEKKLKTTQHKHDPKNYNSISSNWIYAIAEDSSGNLWVGTSSGLDRYDKETSLRHHLTTRDGLPSNSVLSIVPDHLGNLWCGTPNGLFRYDLKSKIIRTYQTTNGLLENTFLAGAGYLSPDGTLYFGQTGGFLYFNPADFNEIERQSAITFTNFEKNGMVSPIGIDYTDSADVFIPYKDSFFSFEFSELDFGSPKTIRYAYKLDGVKDDWIDLKQDRKISFANLEPGSYTLLVKSTDRNGNWHKNYISAGINIIPEFWQTVWFKVLIIFLSFILVIGILLYRIIQIRKIEKVRWQIAGDLHDEIGGTLSSIALRIQLLLKSENKIDVPDKIHLNTVAESALETVNKIDDIVWAINPNNDTLEDLIFRIKDFTTQYLQNHNINSNFLISNYNPEKKLDVEVKKNIMLIYKEIVNNVIKHARANVALITIKTENSQLQITVEDDGIGFNVSDKIEKSKRHGLKNQISRAKEIGGIITIDSSINNGTKVDFLVKI